MRNKISDLIGMGLAMAPMLAVAQPVTDVFATFSQTIAARNIFDPNRGLHSGITLPQTGTPSLPQAVGIQLVGTMGYEKGEFAFFQGSSDELSQVLQAGDKIAGYTVTDITGNEVGLKSADSGDRLELTIGDGLQQEKDEWVYRSADALQGMNRSANALQSMNHKAGTFQRMKSFVFSFTQQGSPGLAPDVAPSGLENNDVLKRLMEQRAKENQ
jgi:hypothetical protein